MGEFELIEQFFKAHSLGAGVLCGIGDDCAVLQVPEGKQLAVSMDTLLADVHFPANADPELIAERALRTNLSDLAAMAAEPLWFTLGLTLPSSDDHWLAGFARGLFKVADQYNITLVGGDTTRGDQLTITIQVHGALEPGSALTRSEASVGDLVCVSGPLGDGAAALAVLQGQLKVGASAFNYFSDRFYKPEPKLAQAQFLSAIANSCLDISDGLMADLNHICQASGVGARVDIDQLPLSEPMLKLVDEPKAHLWALTGGDDYQLCFTLSKTHLGRLQEQAEKGHLEYTVIGEITDGREVECFHNGRKIQLTRTGYNHFS